MRISPALDRRSRALRKGFLRPRHRLAAAGPHPVVAAAAMPRACRPRGHLHGFNAAIKVPYIHCEPKAAPLGGELRVAAVCGTVRFPSRQQAGANGLHVHKICLLQAHRGGRSSSQLARSWHGDRQALRQSVCHRWPGFQRQRCSGRHCKPRFVGVRTNTASSTLDDRVPPHAPSCERCIAPGPPQVWNPRSLVSGW